jgi:hypothetical protein
MKTILLLMLAPFVATAIFVGAMAGAIIIMAPFSFFVTLVLYKFNLREMLDMEFGTNLRKLSEEDLTAPVKKTKKGPKKVIKALSQPIEQPAELCSPSSDQQSDSNQTS